MLKEKRVRKIIEHLLVAEDYTTVPHLAKVVGASRRTVFRDLEIVEMLLEEVGLTLDKTPGKGICITGSDEAKEAMGHRLSENTPPSQLEMDKRRQLLLGRLLRERETEKLYYFASEFNVSESTISYDMDALEPWLAKRGLKLIRKPGRGVSLECGEKELRKAMIDYLYTYYDPTELGRLIAVAEEKTSPLDAVTQEMLSLVDREHLARLLAVMSGPGQHLTRHLAQSAYVGLAIHLAIAIARIRDAETIFMNPDVLDELRSDGTFDRARELADLLEETFGCAIPDDEVGYITMHLKGSKLRESILNAGHDSLISNFDLSRLAMRMIRHYAALSGEAIERDEKLLIGLVSHLRPTLTRLRLGLDIRNPLLEKIQDLYPVVYKKSEIVAGDLSELAGGVRVPPQEVGFLAMHFGAAVERLRDRESEIRSIRVGVLCASGVGTSSLLASRLKKTFPSIKIVGQYAREELGGRKLAGDPDLVVATIEVQGTDRPVVTVNPLLLEEDQQKVEQMLHLVAVSVAREQVHRKEPAGEGGIGVKELFLLSQSILSIIEGLSVKRQAPVTHFQDLVREMAHRVGRTREEQKRIKSALEERENLGNTYLADESFLLLHAKCEVKGAPRVHIACFDKTVTIRMPDRRDVPVKTVLVIIVPISGSPEEREVLGWFSRSLIEVPHFIDTLATGDQEGIKSSVQRIFEERLRRRMQGRQ